MIESSQDTFLEEESVPVNNHKVVKKRKQATLNDELDEYIAHHYIAIPQIDKP
jgi:hypothetical protein